MATNRDFYLYSSSEVSDDHSAMEEAEVQLVMNSMLDELDLDFKFRKSNDPGPVVTSHEKTMDMTTSTVVIETREVSTSVNLEMTNKATLTVVGTSTVFTSTSDTVVQHRGMSTQCKGTTDTGTMTVVDNVDQATSPKQMQIGQPMTMRLKFVGEIQQNKEVNKENDQPTPSVLQALAKPPTLRLGLSRSVKRPLNVRRID